MSVIMTGPAEDYPSHMARRLAKYGYRPDTIEAAIINSFGYPISRGYLNDLCRQMQRKPRQIQPAKGLMVEDTKYREAMEKANAEFVARLIMARAA